MELQPLGTGTTPLSPPTHPSATKVGAQSFEIDVATIHPTEQAGLVSEYFSIAGFCKSGFLFKTDWWVGWKAMLVMNEYLKKSKIVLLFVFACLAVGAEDAKSSSWFGGHSTVSECISEEAGSKTDAATASIISSWCSSYYNSADPKDKMAAKCALDEAPNVQNVAAASDIGSSCRLQVFQVLSKPLVDQLMAADAANQTEKARSLANEITALQKWYDPSFGQKAPWEQKDPWE